MSKNIQYTLRMLCNHVIWFRLVCLCQTKSLYRHSNRALTGNNFFLPLVVCLLFFVIPDFVCRANSPYINKVYTFRPAPGQFVNEFPKYESGDTEETMRQKVETALADNSQTAVSLGGWGGYIVVGFDHLVVNVKDQRDIRIYGNAFYADEHDPSAGGSAEPGVIYVSYDANGNGLPDDKWYEIAGSEYSQSTKNYELTYFRTPADHTRTPRPADEVIDDTYIRWRDSNGNTGYIEQNRYHLQNYYPQWLTADKLVYSGTLLPNNAVPYKEGAYTNYLLYSFDYGYADNHPNDTEGSCINIDWAVNNKGEQVHLAGIHFIKVQTGLNQQCGRIGETSTEFAGAEDLHPDAATGLENAFSNPSSNRKYLKDGQLYIIHNGNTFTVTGYKIN